MVDNTSNRLKTHKELLASATGIAPNGQAIWFPTLGQTTLEGAELVFGPGSVHAGFDALLGSAHFMYKVMNDTREMFNPAVLLLEQHNLDAAVPAFLAHQSALEIAMRCATQGLNKVLLNTRF